MVEETYELMMGMYNSKVMRVCISRKRSVDFASNLVRLSEPFSGSKYKCIQFCVDLHVTGLAGWSATRGSPNQVVSDFEDTYAVRMLPISAFKRCKYRRNPTRPDVANDP